MTQNSPSSDAPSESTHCPNPASGNESAEEKSSSTLGGCCVLLIIVAVVFGVGVYLEKYPVASFWWSVAIALLLGVYALGSLNLLVASLSRKEYAVTLRRALALLVFSTLTWLSFPGIHGLRDAWGAKSVNCLMREDKDVALAVEYYQKAEAKGYHNCSVCNRIGASYATGDGVAKDEAEADKWFRKAAEQGKEFPLGASYYLVGLCYATGDGVAKDEAEADKWFHKAAEQGVPFAVSYMVVSEQYAKGAPGVEQNAAEAERWRRKAEAAEQEAQPAPTGTAPQQPPTPTSIRDM